MNTILEQIQRHAAALPLSSQAELLYLRVPKIQTLSGKLSWSHYCEILKADDDLEFSFYMKQAEGNHRMGVSYDPA